MWTLPFICLTVKRCQIHKFLLKKILSERENSQNIWFSSSFSQLKRTYPSLNQILVFILLLVSVNQMVCFQQTITRKSKTFVNSLCFPGLSKSLYFMKEILRTILRLSVLQLYNTNAWPFLMLTISAIYNSAITIYAIVHQRDYKATSCPWNECVQRNKKWKALFYFAFGYC